MDFPLQLVLPPAKRPGRSGSENRGPCVRPCVSGPWACCAQGPRAGSRAVLTWEPDRTPPGLRGEAGPPTHVTDGDNKAQAGQLVGGRQGQRAVVWAPAPGARALHAQQDLRARPQVPGAPREPGRSHGLERIKGTELRGRRWRHRWRLTAAGRCRQQLCARRTGAECAAWPLHFQSLQFVLCRVVLKEGRSVWARPGGSCHLY